MKTVSPFLMFLAWGTCAIVVTLAIASGVAFYQQWRMAGMSPRAANISLALYIFGAGLLFTGLLGAASLMGSF